MGLGRGFTHYEDYPTSLGQIALSSALTESVINTNELRRLIHNHDILNRKPAEVINNSFLNWLSAQNDQQPFFAFLNYYDAHEPYLPPSPFAEQFGPARPRGDYVYEIDNANRARKWEMTPAELQIEIDAYDGAIAYLDHSINQLIQELETRQLLDNTIVIVTSDHGEQLGEHGLFDHANSLYIQALHVPLMIVNAARVPGKTRVDHAVTLRDLPATVLDLLGIDNTLFPGESLARYWESGRNATDSDDWLSEINKSGPAKRPWYPIADGDMKSVMNEQFHYIRAADGTEELYDIVEDPEENVNLVDSAEYTTVLTALRQSLADYVA
jgi:arylsulfatase A-like enzyme